MARAHSSSDSKRKSSREVREMRDICIFYLDQIWCNVFVKETRDTQRPQLIETSYHTIYTIPPQKKHKIASSMCVWPWSFSCVRSFTYHTLQGLVLRPQQHPLKPHDPLENLAPPTTSMHLVHHPSWKLYCYPLPPPSFHLENNSLRTASFPLPKIKNKSGHHRSRSRSRRTRREKKRKTHDDVEHRLRFSRPDKSTHATIIYMRIRLAINPNELHLLMFTSAL